MEETTVATEQQDKPKLSQEERSRIMSEAAKRRWAKAKRAGKSAKGKAPAKGKMVAKAAKGRQRQSSTPALRDSSLAIRTAEKRIATLIGEQGNHLAQYKFHESKYMADAMEIESLTVLIQRLNAPVAAIPAMPGTNYYPPIPPTMDQIMSDAPLQYQQPQVPRQARPAPQIPAIPVPQNRHPVNTAAKSRAGGGAVGTQLEEEEEPQREGQFLNSPGGREDEWH